MASRHLITTFGLLLASALTAAGDVAELRALQIARRANAAALDSLGQQRRALVVSADSLSDLISHLKQSDAESAELGEAILSAMALVQQIVTIDHAMDSRSARRDSLTEQLRSAYDWEIGTLIESLSEELDEGLLHQLIIFQDARHALGEDVVASRMRYPVDMVVEDTDGPDEIRQKIDLLDGKSGLLREQLAWVGEPHSPVRAGEPHGGQDARHGREAVGNGVRSCRLRQGSLCWKCARVQT